MRKFLTLALAFVMLFSTVACSTNVDPKDSNTDPSTDAPTGDAKVDEVPETFFVANGGESGYSVVRADEAAATIKTLSIEFRAELEKRVGSTISIGNDFLMPGNDPDPTAKEILIGDTNREESVKLRALLDAAGEGERFAVYAAGPKVAVIGTSTYMTYKGLCHLLDGIVTDADGNAVLELTKGYEYVSDVYTVATFDIAEEQAAGRNLVFNVGKKVAKLPNNDGYGTLQGGGSDGTYAYYAMINSTNDNAYIYKYRIDTWELVKRSGALPTVHSNDITYDPVNNRLVLSTCTANDGYLGVCTVDADTLELIDSFKIGVPIRALDYLPGENRYLLGTNFYFTLTDENFNVIQKIDCPGKNYTSQGLCCDGKYIYDVRYIKSSTTHCVVVQGLDGTYYGEITLNGAPSEPENMFRHGDIFYIGCNGADSVYEVELLPEHYW